MPKYTFVDTWVTIYHIEAEDEEEARELACETDSYHRGMEFGGTELVAIDDNYNLAERQAMH